MPEMPRSEFLLYQTEGVLAKSATCKDCLQVRAEGRRDKLRALWQVWMQKLLVGWIRLDECTTVR